MGSMFDSEVYARKRHTPWARISLLSMISELVQNDGDGDGKVSLSAQYRHDVASRIWCTLEWTSEDGKRKEVSAQTLDLCLWRAAHSELLCREKIATADPTADLVKSDTCKGS